MRDHGLSEQAANIVMPSLDDLPVENRDIYRGQNGYERYSGDGVSPMPVPGGSGAYIANGSEHDPVGDTTHLPIRHIEMTQRRFNKLKVFDDGPYESENTDHSIAVMTWGGSKGPTREAYDQMMSKGLEIGWYYTMQINPLPAKQLEELKQKDLVIVPELNYLGQLSMLLRSKGVNAESITQYTGTPFKVDDLVSKLTNRLHDAKKDLVKA